MFYLLARHESDNHKQTKGGKEFSFSNIFYPKGYFASDIINCIIKTLSKELYCTSERKYAQLFVIYLSFFRHQFSYKKEVWRWKRMTTCFFVLFFVAWSSSVFGFWNIGVELSWGICKIKSIVYRRLDMQALRY